MSEMALRTLVDDLLFDQQNISVVERFSLRHANEPRPVNRKQYRDLIPLSAPREGEQYAFEVDLDACSGCKACVVACHSLNGLDEDESWRDVGSLVGEDFGIPVQQTVTAACHHCEDPACLNGCPTKAYHKDPGTGIVKHLDDQCIGCRYCELKCPYEVPKYNARLGIVRKCDMCHGRLAEGEAPACVQACPNEAIKIRIVSREEIAGRSGPDERLVPGTVGSDYTKPTTRYLNLREGGKPVDQDTVKPSHGHTPLAWMLAMTQAAVGIVAIDWLAKVTQTGSQSILPPAIGAALFLAGLTGSVLHLGQPLKAWKAFLGWRTSWLSREIIAFGILAGLFAAYLGSLALPLPSLVWKSTGGLSVLVGLAAVWTSVMVYGDTRRAFWSIPLNTLRFYSTILGAGLILSPWPTVAALPILASLGLDFSISRGGKPKLAKSSILMKRELGAILTFRYICGLLSIAFLPVPWISLACFLLAELAGRRLFFEAVDEPGMPGVQVEK